MLKINAARVTLLDHPRTSHKAADFVGALLLEYPIKPAADSFLASSMAYLE